MVKVMSVVVLSYRNTDGNTGQGNYGVRLMAGNDCRAHGEEMHEEHFILRNILQLGTSKSLFSTFEP